MLENISNFNSTASIEEKRKVAAILGFNAVDAVDIQFSAKNLNWTNIELRFERSQQTVHSAIRLSKEF